MNNFNYLSKDYLENINGLDVANKIYLKDGIGNGMARVSPSITALTVLFV